MDGQAAIERNGEALRRVLASLVVMAGLAGDRPMLPRHLRNAVLRLLRPAESAARRLVVALARSIVVQWPAANPPHGKRAGIASSRGGRAPACPGRALPHALPLLDPLKNPFRIRRTYVPAHLAPRISLPGVTERRPLPQKTSPHDPIDARGLGLRFDALAHVLGDLPRAATRFARLRARNAQRGLCGGRVRWPLRPGRPPGFSARRGHEVHAILAHAHELALWALEHPG